MSTFRCDDHPQTLIVVGPPGSGKSTQAARIAERLGLVHFNPGALLRDMAADGSPLGQQIRELVADGKLVPDDVIDEVVAHRLKVLPAEQGVVLDGYPRTVDQAQALHRLLAEVGRLQDRPVVVRLDVLRDDLLQRLRRRRESQGRDDDTDEVIARRLDVYETQTAPVVDAVADWADVVTINSAQPAEAVTEEILAELCARARPTKL
jgi:adenylate kinase